MDFENFEKITQQKQDQIFIFCTCNISYNLRRPIFFHPTVIIPPSQDQKHKLKNKKKKQIGNIFPVFAWRLVLNLHLIDSIREIRAT